MIEKVIVKYRKKAIFRSRKKQTRIKMANKNTIWVRADQKEMCNKIIKFLIEEVGTKRRTNIGEINYSTGINRESISACLKILAFRENPSIRLIAARKFDGDKVSTYYQVKLR